MHGKIARLPLFQKHYGSFSGIPFLVKTFYDFHQLLAITNLHFSKTCFAFFSEHGFDEAIEVTSGFEYFQRRFA
jgi:hypothetical protein